MYNFSVDIAHTYFVGDGQWLVHNQCGGAFDIAKSGGRHSGFYKNYLSMTDGQIKKGIRSINKEIAEHQEKIVNPHKFIPNWDSLDARQQRHLIETQWPGDIRRQQEQIDILQGILNERGS